MDRDAGTPSSADIERALNQTAALCTEVFGGKMRNLGDDGFVIGAADSAHMVRGQLVNDTIELQIELARFAARANVPMFTLARACVDKRTRLRVSYAELPASEASEAPELVLTADLPVAARPIGLARRSALEGALREFAHQSESLRALMPSTNDAAKARQALYAKHESLRAIDPHHAGTTVLAQWATETVEFLHGGFAVAIAAPSRMTQDLALATLAELLESSGGGLAEVITPAVDASVVARLAGKAPGLIAVPACNLQVGTYAYAEAELPSTLATLGSEGTAICLFGTLAELQGILHGGQGGEADPLTPVLRVVPPVCVELEALIDLSLRRVAAEHLTTALLEAATPVIADALRPLPTFTAHKLIPPAARLSFTLHRDGVALERTRFEAFVQRAQQARETLGGLPRLPPVGTLSPVREAFARRLTDPELGAFLTQEVLAQEQAVDEVCSRLRTESLARPAAQPLRLALLGGPGTGKSMTASSLARWLDVPHLYIDAGSMASSYHATAQLLGSGRGLVGSNRRGVLEEAAQVPGVVVEVADLDHATADTRYGVSDLFLGMLELGVGQSAKGPKFSVCNMLIVFTLNLPGGKDEQLHRRFGFGHPPSYDTVLTDARQALGEVFSSAFLSRLGPPVIYAPLDRSAYLRIVRTAMREAIETAAERLGHPAPRVDATENAAAAVLASHPIHDGGARGLLDAGRASAVDTYLASSRICALGREPLVPDHALVLDHDGEHFFLASEPSDHHDDGG